MDAGPATLQEDELKFVDGSPSSLQKKGGKQSRNIEKPRAQIPGEPENYRQLDQGDPTPTNFQKGSPVPKDQFKKRGFLSTVDFWPLGFYLAISFLITISIVFHWFWSFFILFVYLVYVCASFRKNNTLVEAIMSSENSWEYYDHIKRDRTKPKIYVYGEAYHYVAKPKTAKGKKKSPGRKQVTFRVQKTLDIVSCEDFSMSIDNLQETQFDVKHSLLFETALIDLMISCLFRKAVRRFEIRAPS